MMEVEFYRGRGGGNRSDHYDQLDRSRYSDRYNEHGSSKSVGSDKKRFYYQGFKEEHNDKQSSSNKTRQDGAAKDNTSVDSLDSTGKRKSFRRLLARFADKTSMVGVLYISNAKYWWAKLIWGILLLSAIAVMILHLWYTFDQYYSWPKVTKIQLGFDSLAFPEVTICNTNTMHKGRFDKHDGAKELKDLVRALQPENLVPDQFDANYDPLADNSNNNNNTNNNNNNNNNDIAQNNDPTATGQPPATGSSVTNPGVTNGQQPSAQPPQQRKKRFVSNYENFNISQYDNRKEPFPRDLKPQGDDDFNGEVDETTRIEDLFKELYMDLGRNVREHLGHNITDMLLSCTFNGRKCGPNMFKLHQTAEYGNCWSIYSDQFKVKTSGPSGGLSLILYLEVTEYLKGVTNGYGTRIQIHQTGTYPFPAEEGLYIPASMETDIGLKMISISRLDGNYGNCDHGTTFKQDLDLRYSRRACQQFCKMTHTIDTCKCFNDAGEEFARLKDQQLRPCRSETEVQCMVDIETAFEEQRLDCNCENPCEETQYVRSVSQRQWPSDEYAMVLLQGICEKDRNVCKNLRDNIDDKRATSNNFLKLNIYYEDLNYEYITEHPEIELQQFLSDIGGAIGLWIGLSVLSLCEVVQLFLELCNYGRHKMVKERTREKKRLKKERERIRNEHNRALSQSNKESQWPSTRFGMDNTGLRNGLY